MGISYSNLLNDMSELLLMLFGGEREGIAINANY